MPTADQLTAALNEQKSSGHRLGYVLVKLGLVQELEVTKVLARQYRMPAVDLTKFEVDPRIAKLVPSDLAIKHLLLCRIEKRPAKLDLDVYPFLPRASVATTSPATMPAAVWTTLPQLPPSPGAPMRML